MSGVLNDEFWKCAKTRKFTWKRRIEKTTWGSCTYYNLANRAGTTFAVYQYRGNRFTSLNCCGIDELRFTNIRTLDTRNLDDNSFKLMIAKYIVEFLRPKNRVYIVGIPLKNPRKRSQSQYDFNFYQRLLKVLLEFGFKQVNEQPYLNTNSRNLIVALTVQQEAKDAPLQAV